MVEKWRPDHLFQSAEGAAQSGMFFDYIVVTVKNVPDGSIYGTVSNIIRPILESNRTIFGGRVTKILLVQNGIDIEKELLEDFKEAQYELSLLSGVQMIASTKVGPGIKQKGKDSLSVGPFNPDDHDAISAAHKFVSIYSNEGSLSLYFFNYLFDSEKVLEILGRKKNQRFQGLNTWMTTLT